MCKRSNIGTCMKVNALQDNAHSSFYFFLLILSAIFSSREVVVFLYHLRKFGEMELK